ncbi:MAG: nickel-responsive transcriptional regulator NikR [Verrucomicrobiota bacterium]|nr:nickel-responsive transcriptional regulator NikR [Verrucomicrobiota bacterium]
MSNLVRLSFSVEEGLFNKLESLVERNGYSNRSEFIRDTIRNILVEEEWEQDKEVVGTITLIYDHHASKLSEKLTDIQHEYHDLVLASTHIHISHSLCAEMIMIKGASEKLKHLTSNLQSQKGVLHTGLTMTSTGAGVLKEERNN